jgi:hypothetical protein
MEGEENEENADEDKAKKEIGSDDEEENGDLENAEEDDFEEVICFIIKAVFQT